MKGLLLHHQDLDGYCSAAVVVNSLRKVEWSILGVGYNYFPWEKIKTLMDEVGIVAMVDFSWVRDMDVFLREISSRGLIFVWTDHHETTPVDIMLEHGENPWSYFAYSKKKSGALLTWELLNPGERPPLAVELANRYDLWLFKEGDPAEAFNRVITLVSWGRDPLSPEWKKCLEDEYFLKEIIRFGQSIVENDNFWSKKAAGAGHLFKGELLHERLFGYKGKLINSTDLISKKGNSALDEADFAIVFSIDRKGVKFHLRGDGSIDLSKVAEDFGGGGHRAAAGFHLPLEKGFELLFDLYSDLPTDTSLMTEEELFGIFKKTGRNDVGA